jgi:putative addiction module component (TIGR02574 family)
VSIATLTPAAGAVVESALKLSAAERRAIAERLLESVDLPPNAYESPEALRAELLRRIEAYDRGEMKAYTLEEAMAKIRTAREDRES